MTNTQNLQSDLDISLPIDQLKRQTVAGLRRSLVEDILNTPTGIDELIEALEVENKGYIDSLVNS